MARRLNDEQKCLAIYLLQQGKSIGYVANIMKCSERTINRIKKEIAPKSENGTISNNIRHLEYTPKDLKMQERLAKERVLFEDTEEGWIYGSSLSKEYSKVNQFSKWWSAIVYPESAPEDWKEKLRNKGYELAISPLHDKDKWEHDSPEKEVMCEDGTMLHIEKGLLYKKGDLKKAHWHIIVKVDVRTSFREMDEELQNLLKCPRIQKCRSLKGAYEYFMHLNNPERYQYDRDEIEEYNGFTLEPNAREKTEILQDIMRTCEEECIEDFSELVRRFIDEPEYLSVIGTKAFAIKTLTDSIWKRNHPDHIKKVKIVE